MGHPNGLFAGIAEVRANGVTGGFEGFAFQGSLDDLTLDIVAIHFDQAAWAASRRPRPVLIP